MRSLHLSAHRDAAQARVCLQCLFRTCHQHCPCSAECSCPPWFPQYPGKGKALSPLPADHTCAGTAHPTLWGWRSVPPRAGRMLGPGSKQHQPQLLCSFLPGLFACVGCMPRCRRRRESAAGERANNQFTSEVVEPLILCCGESFLEGAMGTSANVQRTVMLGSYW